MDFVYPVKKAQYAGHFKVKFPFEVLGHVVFYCWTAIFSKYRIQKFLDSRFSLNLKYMYKVIS